MQPSPSSPLRQSGKNPSARQSHSWGAPPTVTSVDVIRPDATARRISSPLADSLTSSPSLVTTPPSNLPQISPPYPDSAHSEATTLINQSPPPSAASTKIPDNSSSLSSPSRFVTTSTSPQAQSHRQGTNTPPMTKQTQQLGHSTPTPPVFAERARDKEAQERIGRNGTVDLIPVHPLPTAAHGTLPKTTPRMRPVDDNSSTPKHPTTSSSALRFSVLSRLVFHPPEREKRVDTILSGNRQIASQQHRDQGISHKHTSTPPLQFPVHVQVNNTPNNKPRAHLIDLFNRQKLEQTDKESLLAQEYLSLRKDWLKHCQNLDVAAATAASQANNNHGYSSRSRNTMPSNGSGVSSVSTITNIPSTGGSTTGSKHQQPSSTAGTGRTTTRRLTMAARSDLEMEQILASLDAEGATDPNQLCLRNVARIPDMYISPSMPSFPSSSKTRHHRTPPPPPNAIRTLLHRYYNDDSTTLVPPALLPDYYTPSLNHWTPEEEAAFTSAYSAFPKAFGKVHQFMTTPRPSIAGRDGVGGLSSSKTVRDLVDYYYTRKKGAVNFRKLAAGGGGAGRRRRRLGAGVPSLSKGGRGKALLTDIRMHDHGKHHSYRAQGGLDEGEGVAIPLPPLLSEATMTTGIGRKGQAAAVLGNKRKKEDGEQQPSRKRMKKGFGAVAGNVSSVEEDG